MDTRSRMHVFMHEQLYNTSCVSLAFCFTDMFFIIPMFVAWYMPLSFVIGACSIAATIIAGICMCKATVTSRGDERISLQRLLMYYPVKISEIRKELYGHLIRYTLIQELVTITPMLILAMSFEISTFLAAVASTGLTMFFIGGGIIEVNMLCLRRHSNR